MDKKTYPNNYFDAYDLEKETKVELRNPYVPADKNDVFVMQFLTGMPVRILAMSFDTRNIGKVTIIFVGIQETTEEVIELCKIMQKYANLVRTSSSRIPIMAYATELRVNIGSGNGLLPDGTKRSPEPRLTYGWGIGLRPMSQGVNQLVFSIMSVKSMLLRLLLSLSGANELKTNQYGVWFVRPSLSYTLIIITLDKYHAVKACF